MHLHPLFVPFGDLQTQWKLKSGWSMEVLCWHRGSGLEAASKPLHQLDGRTTQRHALHVHTERVVNRAATDGAFTQVRHRAAVGADTEVAAWHAGTLRVCVHADDALCLRCPTITGRKFANSQPHARCGPVSQVYLEFGILCLGQAARTRRATAASRRATAASALAVRSSALTVCGGCTRYTT